MQTLGDLFLVTLQDIYAAERHLLRALSKMARAAQNEALKKAFTDHREQTERHVERLQKVFDLIGKPARPATCEAMQALIKECSDLLDEMLEPSAVRDAGLIACGQAVEHYEMARYGTLAAWAEVDGQREITALLRQTHNEEIAAETLLNHLATQVVNRDALKPA